MNSDSFKNARFVKTAVFFEDYPDLIDKKGKKLPEIAVVGRSNVGKSSLLNHLFQKNGLVKTSAQPGKTQTLNFFISNDEIAFADIPGYGYAKVPPSVRKQWGPMIQTYFNKRETLELILLLFDIRRKPTEEDLQMVQWILESGRSMILVITKTDKVNQSEKNKNIEAILRELQIANLDYVLYSTIKNLGRKELISKICEAMNG